MAFSKFKLYPFQYFPNFYIKEKILELIKNEIKFKQNTVKIGKDNIERLERRKTCWLSNDKNLTFEYSSKIMNPDPIPDIFNELLSKIKNSFGIDFDGILVNYYEKGNIGMGYHSDPTDDKWTNDFIILSIGETRKLIFREKENHENKITYNFNNGDIIYMFNNCQETYEHSIRKINSNNERISLVFKKKKD